MIFNLLDGVMDKYVILIGVISFVILLSWLIHHFVEKKLSAYLNKQLNKLIEKQQKYFKQKKLA